VRTGANVEAWRDVLLALLLTKGDAKRWLTERELDRSVGRLLQRRLSRDGKSYRAGDCGAGDNGSRIGWRGHVGQHDDVLILFRAGNDRRRQRRWWRRWDRGAGIRNGRLELDGRAPTASLASEDVVVGRGGDGRASRRASGGRRRVGRAESAAGVGVGVIADQAGASSRRVGRVAAETCEPSEAEAKDARSDGARLATPVAATTFVGVVAAVADGEDGHGGRG
jgi:hypothetical protein